MGVKKTVIRGRGIGGAAEIRPGSGAQERGDIAIAVRGRDAFTSVFQGPA